MTFGWSGGWILDFKRVANTVIFQRYPWRAIYYFWFSSDLFWKIQMIDAIKMRFRKILSQRISSASRQFAWGSAPRAVPSIIRASSSSGRCFFGTIFELSRFRPSQNSRWTGRCHDILNYIRRKYLRSTQCIFSSHSVCSLRGEAYPLGSVFFRL